jgi:hypothetical protein
MTDVIHSPSFGSSPQTTPRLQTIKESAFDNSISLFGTPFDFNKDPWQTPWLGGYQFDYWPDRTITIWQMVSLTLSRLQAKYLCETNPNAAGILLGLKNYICGSGSQIDFATVDGEEPPKQLTTRLNKFINRFKRYNRWKGQLERDLVMRLVRDGEAFIRFYPQPDGVTRIQFIEPMMIAPPMGESHTGPWSFGIYTPDDDAAHPTAYCIHDIRDWIGPFAGRDEIVPSTHIVHIKINVPTNCKRGVSSFYAAGQELIGAHRLRYTTRESEIVRACIAYIIKGPEGAGAEELRALQQQLITDPAQVISTITNTRTLDFANKQPGQEVIINDGMEYEPPPEGPYNENSGVGVQQALDSVACRFNCPPWLAGSPSDNTSYAQSLTTESPFVKALESFHVEISDDVNSVFEAAINIGVAQGELPAYILDDIELNTTFPSPVVRNGLEESKRRELLNKNKILSRATWAAEEGYDYEQEQSHLASEPEFSGEGVIAGGDSEKIDGKAPETSGGLMQRDQEPANA